jgi:hypothetical protein
MYMQQISNYYAVYFVINGDIFTEMALSSRTFCFGNSIMESNQRAIASLLGSFGVQPNPDYVFNPSPIENERYLIFRFIKSIFQDTKETVYLFESDTEYKTFCHKNNLEYGEQEWFKRMYINDSIQNVQGYLLKNSLVFQELYFPEGTSYSREFPSLHEAKSGNNSHNFKPDFNEIYSILKRNNVMTFYHFTDESNIVSIKKSGGLYSNSELQKKYISPRYASGGDSRSLDKSTGLDEYVRLSLTKSHPMMHTALTCGRIGRPKIIEINPLIALMPNVLFSDRNALRKGAKIGSTHNDLLNINFNLIQGNTSYLDMFDDEKMYYQAEILVKGRIGSEMFLNIDKL